MSGILSRSWEITKLSFRVIKQDKELLVFPILAGIFSLAFIILMAIPYIIPALLSKTGSIVFTALEYLFVFLIYLGTAFIATFFNVCVVYTAKKRFTGGNATFGESIGFAFKKIHLIFAWSLLAATVGLILNIISRMADRAKGVLGIVMKVLVSFLGLAWAIVTVFVVPAMVYHDVGPFNAIKRSVAALKKTWGESLIRVLGLGLVQFLFSMILIGFFVILGIALSVPLGIMGVIIAVVLGILFLVLLSLVFGVASNIFNAALYEYASTGKVPGAYSKEIMQHAFKEQASKMKAGFI